MTVRDYRIALLLCDVPVPPVKDIYGDYGQIFEDWLQGALESFPETAVAKGVNVIVDRYDVVNANEYPALDRLKPGAEGSYDALMLTGSKHTAHEGDPAFIPELISFVRKCGTEPDFDKLKIVGICFGHQITALAMGGVSQRGENGWEVGVYGAKCTEAGKAWFYGPADKFHSEDRIYIEQMHRDQVPRPPPGFEVCLFTDKYPVQAMVKPHVSSTPERPVGHILTIQGHPELLPDMVEKMIDLRSYYGTFDEDTTVEARRRAWGKDKQGGEGLGRVGWSVWRMLLSSPSA